MQCHCSTSTVRCLSVISMDICKYAVADHRHTAMPYRADSNVYVLFSDREGGENHLLLSSILTVHSAALRGGQTPKTHFIYVSVLTMRGLRVLRFSEFTMRKINIYSVNVEINWNMPKKKKKTQQQ